MALDDSDYFKWFNDEITRYRNYEWQVSGYVGALLFAVGVWAGDINRNSLIIRHRCLAGTLLAIFVVFCAWSQLHIHERLNFFRVAQKALREGKPCEEALKVGYSIVRGTTDAIYLVAFEAFDIGMGIIAIYAVCNAPH